MTQWGLDTLFNPAKRHMDEEKQRLQSTREEVGDNSGGKRINFESGRITIKRPDAESESTDDDPTDHDPTDDDPTDDDPTDDDPTDTQSTGDDDRETPAPTKELTPAQLRAAQRRGRAPK